MRRVLLYAVLAPLAAAALIFGGPALAKVNTAHPPAQVQAAPGLPQPPSFSYQGRAISTWFKHHYPDDGYAGPYGQMGVLCRYVSSGAYLYAVLYQGQTTPDGCRPLTVNNPSGADIWCLIGGGWTLRWTATGDNSVPSTQSWDCTYRLD